MRSGNFFSVEATYHVNGQKTIIFGVMLGLPAPSIVIDCSKQESQAAPPNMALETQAKVDICSLAKRVSYLSKDENIIPLDTVRTFIKLHRTTAVLEVTTDAATPPPPPSTTYKGSADLLLELLGLLPAVHFTAAGSPQDVLQVDVAVPEAGQEPPLELHRLQHRLPSGVQLYQH